MNNVYTDPYMPDEEDLVEVGDLRPWGHEVHYKQGIEKNKQHPNARDNRILCHKTSPWADCIEALEIYESKTP